MLNKYFELKTCTYAVTHHTHRKPTAFSHACIYHVHHIINKKDSCRSKMHKITYLMKKSFRNQLRRCNVPPNHRPVCSLISQQCCHPQAGHDSPRNKVLSRFTHIQGTQINQADTIGFIRLSRRWEKLNAKLVSSWRS